MSVQSRKPRGILIAGNWKMNLGPREAEKFLKDVKTLSEKALRSHDFKLLETGRLQCCLIPTAVSLPAACHAATQVPFPVHIAAQNAHWEKKGAFTGETSGPLLQEIDVKWCLTGHSERRQYFGETDETVRKRTESLLEQGFRVIMCIGETRAEREAARTRDVLHTQLRGACPKPGEGISRFMNGQLVIAYEPVWAIGTGLTATPAQAQEAHEVVRGWLAESCGADAAEKTPILYGGSVTPENAASLLDGRDVDGALVGGASVKPDSYLALLAAGGVACGN